MKENIKQLVNRLDVPGKFVNYNEALIYKVKAKVWKLYPGFSLSTIYKYQALTAQVADYCDGKQWTISAQKGSPAFSFTWRIVQIEQVQEYEDFPLTISQWIEGDSVQDLLDRQEELGETTHPLQQIEAADYGAIQGKITQFCEPLNTALNNSNIWFTTVNAKPITHQLVVTDICPRVSNLQ